MCMCEQEKKRHPHARLVQDIHLEAKTYHSSGSIHKHLVEQLEAARFESSVSYSV